MERFSFNRKKSEKSPAVRRALLSGDASALRIMGRAGAEARARRREEVRTEEEMLRIATERDRKREERERSVQANEHIIPPSEYD